MDAYALVTELKNATEDVLVTGETLILDDTNGVFQMCFVLEKILNNGLKDLSIFGKTPFWQFLEHLDQCLPGTTNILNDIREYSKTPLGRGRVFIRVALNESSVVDYLKALVWNRELSRKFYKDGALIRNDQYFASMLSYLEKLADVKFSLVVKDSGFDDPAYYDKMALELVMSGQRATTSSGLSSSTLSASSLSSSIIATPTPIPAPAPTPSIASTPVASNPSPAPSPRKTQPISAPPQIPREEEAQLSPQVALATTAPKEEKKKSPQAKRKTTARSRTIIEDGGESIEKIQPVRRKSAIEEPQPTTTPSLSAPSATPSLVSTPSVTPTPSAVATPPIDPTTTVSIPSTTEASPSVTLSAPSTPIPTSPDSTQSISESDLVPVKMNSTADTDSVLSSVEMVSSQTSTPSFTAVTDTEFSPLTTPILHDSPKLNILSEDSSFNNTNGSSSSLSALEPPSDSVDTEPSITAIPQPAQEIQTPIQNVTSEPIQQQPPLPVSHTEQPEDTKGNEPPQNITTDAPAFRPPTPTIADFASNELPIEQPTLTKPPTPEAPSPSPPEIKPTLPPLIETLKREVYAVLNGDTLIREADALLQAIENIISHGIRSGAVFAHHPLPLDQVWAFVKVLPNRLPGTDTLFAEIKANREIETDMGRARSWIRASLNHMSLAKHLKVLLGDHKRTIEYFEDSALLRSYEHQATVLVLIDTLSSGRFCLETHDEYIDLVEKSENKKLSGQNEKKKRIVSTRGKKASIISENSSTDAPPSEEIVVIPRRRTSSASRTKRPNFVNSGEGIISTTPPSSSSSPSPSPPTAPVSLIPTLHSRDPEPVRPESPKQNGTNTNTNTNTNNVVELPPMPDIPTSQFVPISGDLLQQLQQLPPDTSQSTPNPPASAELSSTPTSSVSSTPVSNSPPAYTSLHDLPKTIPFGVPEYQPDFAPYETSSYSFPPIDIPKREESSPVSFFKTPLSASFIANSSGSHSFDSSGGNTPLSYSYSASVGDDSRVTVTDDFLRARLSEDYEPRAMSKALDVVRPKTKRGSDRRTSLSDIDADDSGSQRFGTTPDDVAALPAHYILDVTRKVQRNVKCPGCGAAITHGLFSTARLCAYYCAYYCAKCHVGDEAVIPARLVHQLDVKSYPVCSEARGHIHQYYRSPQLDMKALNPSAFRYSSTLDKAGKLRRQLKYLGDYVKTCRNKETLLNLMDGRQYMLDSLNVYSLRDLIDAISGSLLPFMYNIMEKFIAHVTKTCTTCKGKGFFCEFCNSGELLFSWMVLRSSDCTLCPQCKSLAHTRCYKKGNGDCPKCKRIASVKTKPPAPISFLT